TGIHLGPAYVDRIDGKMLDVSGNAITYAERVMNVARPGDILVTNSAVNTILALKGSYQKVFRYAGKYPIKHGEYLQVWSLHISEDIGNPDSPPKKKMLLIGKMSSRNRRLAIALLALAVVGSVLSGQLLLAQISTGVDTRSLHLKQSIENGVEELWSIQDATKQVVERELSKNARSAQLSPDARIGELLNFDSGTISIILALLPSSNAEIKYTWIAETIADECSILLYEPYGRPPFDPDQNFTKRDWCENIQKRSDYLTTTLYASGPVRYVNVLVTRIDEGESPSSETIGYFGLATNWEKIIPQKISEIYGEGSNVRVILEDHGGYVSADCTPKGCTDLTKIVPPIRVNDTFPLDPALIFNGKNCYDESLAPASTAGEPVRESVLIDSVEVRASNPQIMQGWRLHLCYEKPQMLNPIPAFLFAISLAAVGILSYFYIVPRYWLDDTDQFGAKGKFAYQ
ncbi:MAG TPA: hypothetical protein VJM08_14050, partial [Anaerolineales bacterium]|nr:hypothetical protein [Anaerolineales bacterium]